MNRRSFLAMIPIPFLAPKRVKPELRFHPAQKAFFNDKRRVTMYMSRGQLNQYLALTDPDYIKRVDTIPYHYDPNMTWLGLERSNASPFR